MSSVRPSRRPLRGLLRMTSYLGTHIEYTVASPLGELFVIERVTTAVYQPGSDVWLGFAESGVIVVRD